MSLPPTPAGTAVTGSTPTGTAATGSTPTEGAGRVARVRRRVADGGREAGMTTAEYAVGTVAACGFGGVLYKVITDDSIVSLISKLFAKALSASF